MSARFSTQRITDRYPDCVPLKCIHFKRNEENFDCSVKYCHFKSNEVTKGKPVMQESPLTVCNRFQVLASTEGVLTEQHLNAQHGKFLKSQLECK